MGAPPEIFKGNFEGDILHLDHGGPGMHVRLTYDLSEPGYLCTSMEMSSDGNTGTDSSTPGSGAYRGILEPIIPLVMQRPDWTVC